MRSLRLLIRAILKEDAEVLGEPDESAEDEREEGHHEQSVGLAEPGHREFGGRIPPTRIKARAERQYQGSGAGRRGPGRFGGWP